MSEWLKQAGYELLPEPNIWCRPGYGGIAYNDGDEIEQRIASVIEQASDVSVLSTDLRQHCTDWASLYHLSGSRANIMRPLESALHGNVLEIGAGCGAITRYLGELGLNVLALEGSPRRAAIARSRSRDLDNVSVLAEKFDQFECNQQFDFITLIGVLEYANLFTGGENPAQTMLERVGALLKPGGRLIIAIENQLGLKYFAGAPEDHIGEPMYGIEGRYEKNQPQTYGRKVLQTMLNKAGFSQSTFMAPFPDYKLPASIITESGLTDPNFDAGALAWQSVRRDPQLPPVMSFSPELVWPTIFDNGLALDLSNSFLIVASGNEDPLDDPNILAYHYSTNRRAEYCKQTVFIRQNKDIEVTCRMLSNAPPNLNSKILFSINAKSTYASGQNLAHGIVQLIAQDNWSIDSIVLYFEKYLLTLVGLDKHQAASEKKESSWGGYYFPGSFIDATPQNIICLDHTKKEIIDNEWATEKPIHLPYLLFRSILLQLGMMTRIGRPASSSEHLNTRDQLIKAIFKGLGLENHIKEIPNYVLTEAKLQAEVTGLNIEQFMEWQPHALLCKDNTYFALKHSKSQITQLKTSLDETREICEQQICRVNDITKSTSWRMTKPLRKISNAKQLLINLIKSSSKNK